MANENPNQEQSPSIFNDRHHAPPGNLFHFSLENDGRGLTIIILNPGE
jgi:hypothetical protein